MTNDQALVTEVAGIRESRIATHREPGVNTSDLVNRPWCDASSSP
ncbi:MAG TPA: hypothetical protein VFX07_09895 [Candidatus Udaeobacter sp.]|nr:hypothetical protein [Candidatus Udaeobacter sp.]